MSAPSRVIFDSTDYIALGCLVSTEDIASDTIEEVTSGWQDVAPSNPLHGFIPKLAVSIQSLLKSGWIRAQSCFVTSNLPRQIMRVYVLPHDIGLRSIDRSSRKLGAAFELIISSITVNPATWRCGAENEVPNKFDPWATMEPGSLFFQFNAIPSPAPDPRKVTSIYDREAVEDLLSDKVPGLKTRLFPYQRRCAGLMLQRETVESLELDPCLEARTSPAGTVFYYDPWNAHVLKSPRYYEACRGGILAESMGLGKTLICLALILATKDIPARMPHMYALRPTRKTVGSLADMAVSAIHRTSTPWKVEYNRILHFSGIEMTDCMRRLENNPATYEIPFEPVRFNRKTMDNLPEPKIMTMASTTIVVVPRNLCKQWQSEIEKHIEHGVLRVLVMDDARKVLPPLDELRSYDVILFSKSRFELEDRDGSDAQGRRIIQSKTDRICQCPYIGATRTRNCTCVKPDMLYESPLKHIHFKRLIVDEGHFFGNSTKSIAASVAGRLVTADHHWIVSGTPAKDLLGVEVDVSNTENLWQAPDTSESRALVMQRRRDFSEQDKKGAIESLGALASGFLKIRPWSDRHANVKWRDYVFRHEAFRTYTTTGFSVALRRFLESVVVKTRPDDVEQDISIPPLESSVIKLQPSFYDKVTANLFNLVLTANAVTSERTDADYIFHKGSQKARAQLIANLRQSAFFWTGFSEKDVEASVGNSNRYLEKEGTKCSPEDRALLNEVVKSSEVVTQSKGWTSLSRSHELGIFISGWPAESAEHWAFDECQDPLLIGITQLLEAQTLIERRSDQSDPGEGLSGVGIRALAPIREPAPSDNDQKSNASTGKANQAESNVLAKSGIPTSSLEGEPVRKRASTSSSSASLPKRVPQSPTKQSRLPPREGEISTVAHVNAGTLRMLHHLPEQYRSTQIVGTASAKLSYLASQILKYYQEEKILVFYQGDNSAFYIAQMLDLLHIKHEIYAKSLKASMKSDYVVRFNQDPAERVLLMDVQQAALGLNLSSASRIYFVNPVCRPNIEAQAIKRAHRIGQTRKVSVETLVLKDSIEEKMLERSKRMTNAEHNEAKALEDDGGIREIIQNARPLTISTEEMHGRGQMAPLVEPQPLWRCQSDTVNEQRIDLHLIDGPRAPVSAVKSPEMQQSHHGAEQLLVRNGKRSHAVMFSHVISPTDLPGNGTQCETSRQVSHELPLKKFKPEVAVG